MKLLLSLYVVSSLLLLIGRECGWASGSASAGLQVCAGRCIVWAALSPLLYPPLPVWAHNFSLLSVVTSHIVLAFRETQMQMQEGSAGVGMLNCHWSWLQPVWCLRVVPKTLLECTTPHEVSGYFQFVAERLHSAILAAQCRPEVAGCSQFVMLLSIEPSTPQTLKRNFKSVLPYISYSYLRKRVLTHPETYLKIKTVCTVFSRTSLYFMSFMLPPQGIIFHQDTVCQWKSLCTQNFIQWVEPLNCIGIGFLLLDNEKCFCKPGNKGKKYAWKDCQ